MAQHKGYLNKSIGFLTLSVLLFTGCGGENEESIPSSPNAIQNVPLTLSAAVTTFAGSGIIGSADGTGTAASFYIPYGITSDGTNLYITDTNNHTIRQIVIATGVVTTFAGSGVNGNLDGTGTAASFKFPRGITAGGINLFVADTFNHTIRRIEIATGEVTTLAGSGAFGNADGTGTAATFGQPSGIVTDGTHLYVADSLNNKIRRIEIATGVVTTIAGSGAFGDIDGTGTAASFNLPNGITTDGTHLYVTELGNRKIRQIVIATGVVTTLAGTGAIGSIDGAGATATFSQPFGITTDGTNLFVAEQGNRKIRQIIIATGVVTTLAGSGLQGSTNGTGTAASFFLPSGITTDGTHLYVADSFNHIIRQIQ